MTDLVYEVLTRRFGAKDSQYVFTNKKGEVRGYATRALRSAFRRAGIEGVNVHTLRKTFSSWLVQSGVSIFEVSKLLGHSSVQITEQIYGDLAPIQASKRAVQFFNKQNEQSSNIIHLSERIINRGIGS